MCVYIYVDIYISIVKYEKHCRYSYLYNIFELGKGWRGCLNWCASSWICFPKILLLALQSLAPTLLPQLCLSVCPARDAYPCPELLSNKVRSFQPLMFPSLSNARRLSSLSKPRTISRGMSGCSSDPGHLGRKGNCRPRL